jgi:hypothetical protein
LLMKYCSVRSPWPRASLTEFLAVSLDIVITNINKNLETEMYPRLDIRKSP